MPPSLRSTYRLQLRPEFGLDDAAAAADYLRTLGISHLYASPFLQAAPESTHGYDVVDYSQINAELGGPAAFNRLVEGLGRQGLGMILDVVPNHMAISPRNPWWWDVLRNGAASRFAAYFDVDWAASDANTVLQPILGEQYGRVIEAGEIQVVYDGDTFTVHYFDHIYPVDPRSLGGLLAAAAEHSPNAALSFLAGAYDHLPDVEAAANVVPGSAGLLGLHRRYRDVEVLHDLLARLVKDQPETGQSIQAVLAELNADPDALDNFLRHQNYRLALWKISSSELGYRRFFDINNMIGLRMEDKQVYQDTHLLVLELVRRGVLDGLRIDHPDGLRDPAKYFAWLRRDAPDAWIGMEKILEPGERLPETWPVQGTVGYDFLNRLNGLFVDPQGEAPLTQFYESFTGQTEAYPTLVHEKKLAAAKDLLSPDLNRLTELLLQICEQHRRYRDYTRSELRNALAEVAACLPVYRTYVQPRGDAAGVAEADAAYISAAVESAKAARPDLDPRLFDFIADLLLLRVRGPLEGDLVERFQQFSGPVMAKGVEDTAFYIYTRFVSLNEVGGDPGRFGISVDEFHRANAEAQARWPQTMLATSTHDTKRSEDVRARLNVLSEMHGPWTEAVQRWAEMNAPYRTPTAATTRDVDVWPDPNTEYLIYQTLVGAWPVSAERMVQYVQKAVREAKRFTTWTAPNPDYEDAVTNFVQAILTDRRFTADLETFVAGVLQPGRVNAIAQTLLKLTSPGIPDIYQGSEIWNLTLVDPDNRTPVDYAIRRGLLASLTDDTAPETVLAGMESGLPKLWVIRQALALRAQHPDWFGAQSSYTPLVVEEDQPIPAPVHAVREDIATHGETETEESDGLVAVTGQAGENSTGLPAVAHPSTVVSPSTVAYLRGSRVLVAVPRLIVHQRENWLHQHLTLPEGMWRSLLTHQIFSGGSLSLADLWARFPAALLVREGADPV